MSMHLTYGLDDDAAASEYVGHRINQPTPAAWEELFDGDRLAQTHRVLIGIEQSVQTQYAARNAQLEQDRADWTSGLISAKSWATAQAEHADWRMRISTFRGETINHLREAKAEIKRRNVERSNRENEVITFNLVHQLVEAINRHREDTHDPCPADYLLWLRLDLVKLPNGEPISTLIKDKVSCPSDR